MLTFEKRTPSDVLKWVILEHNRYHLGSEFNTTQMYEETIGIVAAWRVHKKANGICTSACPKSGPFSYPRLYAAFIEEKYPKLYTSFTHFNNSKQGFAEMKRMSIWELYKEHVEEWVDHLRKGIKLDVVSKLNLDILNLMKDTFESTLDKDMLAIVALELLKLTLPCMDGGKHKWLLVMHDEKEFLKKLIYPMSGTVFYNPQAQRKSQGRKRKIQDTETEVPAAADEVAETWQ